jgi:hypothetical protein
LKKIVFIIVLALSFTSVKPQASQAPNWTKTDCNGNSHTLYNYLDSNKVAVMIFGMGCSSCIDAISFFSNLKPQYALTHPGKLKVFYMDFFAGNTCSANVTPILVGSNVDAGFDNCASDLANYTNATPMTFLVITAGTSHSIIYSIKKNIFDFSDSVAIKSAIDGFFNTLSVKELNSTKNIIEIYPNPTNGILNLKLESKNTTNASEVSIYNSFGALVRKEDLIFKNNTASINTNELPNGVYELSLEDGVSKRFVIAR